MFVLLPLLVLDNFSLMNLSIFWKLINYRYITFFTWFYHVIENKQQKTFDKTLKSQGIAWYAIGKSYDWFEHTNVSLFSFLPLFLLFIVLCALRFIEFPFGIDVTSFCDFSIRLGNCSEKTKTQGWTQLHRNGAQFLLHTTFYFNYLI
jgi:hypothetical protein